MKKNRLIVLVAAAMTALSGCGSTDRGPQMAATGPIGHAGDHSVMNHSDSGEVPIGLEEAANPAFPVGSQAVIQAEHMKGMKGAKATIAGAYRTVAYVVSYNPADGGKLVKNHKWVIREEIKDAGDRPLPPGTEVVLEADHMKGMKGASAEIVSAEHTTVYMVDYIPTTGGKPVKNHKWMTESELSAK